MEITTKKIRSIFIWAEKKNSATTTTIEHHNSLINKHDLSRSGQDECFRNCHVSTSTKTDRNELSVTNLQKRKNDISVLEVRSVSQEEECIIESAALLLQACAAGDVATVRHICNSQWWLMSTIRTKYGATALHLAARNGHVQVLRTLLDGFVARSPAADLAELVEACDDDGQTALHWAAGSGPAFACSLDCSPTHIQVVSFLVLQARAHVNARSAHGTTPLDNAVRGGHLAVARLLSAHGAQLGADLDNVEEIEAVPPDLDKQPVTMPDLLIEEADDEDTATNISASSRNSVESFSLPKLDSAVETAYKPFADIADEMTSLFDQQTFSMMEGLVPTLNGEQMHIKEESSQITNFGQQNSQPSADVLKNQDQQPNSPTERPNNEIAQIGGSSAAFVSGPIRPIFTLIFLLVLAMAIVVTTSDSGHNLIHFLIRSEGQQPSSERIQQPHSEVIKSTSHSGNLATNQTIIKVPLFTTVCEGRTKDVQKLLNAGVDLHALHCAAKFGHYDTVKLLLERGANANLRDENDRQRKSKRNPVPLIVDCS